MRRDWAWKSRISPFRVASLLRCDGNSTSIYWSLQRKRAKMKRIKLGRHVVSDPRICHGSPTFVGTRIMVAQILEMVADGTPWEEIIAEYGGAISRAAIAETVRLAGRSFSKKCR